MKMLERLLDLEKSFDKGYDPEVFWLYLNEKLADLEKRPYMEILKELEEVREGNRDLYNQSVTICWEMNFPDPFEFCYPLYKQVMFDLWNDKYAPDQSM